LTTAFVLSGGGNRGPLEVGALRSLLKHGIVPDFFAGTSAGSINSAFMAAFGPDLAAVSRLAAGWHTASKATVYGGNILQIGWRLIRGADGLFSSDGMRRLLEQNLPPGVRTFGQLQCPCYITAVDLRSGRLYLFGEEPSAPLVDAVLASSSMPGMHPPVDYHGLQLVDGGVVTTTPAGIAMDKGATVIYAINVGSGDEVQPPVRGVLNILARTLNTFLVQSLLMDLDRASADPAIELHHIHITAFAGLAFDDFEHIDEMISAGEAATDGYLAHPQPRLVAPRGAKAAAEAVPGAREYIPVYAHGAARGLDSSGRQPVTTLQTGHND
jgi:NTE family protein